MNPFNAKAGALTLLIASTFLAPPALAQADLKCNMHFSMKGWSAFYKTASGRGVIGCNDGSSMDVALTSKGGGLTLGKSSIDDGYGEFTGVSGIRETLGAYATGGAHGAAADSGGAVSALTKGEVSLALKGNSRGFDAGIDFGKFTISEISPLASSEVPEATPSQ